MTRDDRLVMLLQLVTGVVAILALWMVADVERF